MIIGQHLAPNTTSPSQLYYYTPWMPAHGDTGIYTIEIIDINDSVANLQVDVNAQTKAADEADPSAGTSIASSAITSSFVGEHSQTMTGCKELVRFQIKVTGIAADDWIHARMLNVTWVTN